MADRFVVMQLSARTYRVGIMVGWAGSSAQQDAPIYRVDGQRFSTLFAAESEVNRRKASQRVGEGTPEKE